MGLGSETTHCKEKFLKRKDKVLADELHPLQMNCVKLSG
jgi:hypothetical protein